MTTPPRKNRDYETEPDPEPTPVGSPWGLVLSIILFAIVVIVLCYLGTASPVGALAVVTTTRMLSKDDLDFLMFQKGFTYRKTDGIYTVFGAGNKGMGRFSKRALLEWLTKQNDSPEFLLETVKPGEKVSLEGLSPEERDARVLAMTKS